MTLITTNPFFLYYPFLLTVQHNSGIYILSWANPLKNRERALGRSLGSAFLFSQYLVPEQILEECELRDVIHSLLLPLHSAYTIFSQVDVNTASHLTRLI